MFCVVARQQEFIDLRRWAIETVVKDLGIVLQVFEGIDEDMLEVIVCERFTTLRFRYWLCYLSIEMVDRNGQKQLKLKLIET